MTSDQTALFPATDCVVVFAPNWLGDAVMALPAIADVRRHFAGARFVVAARASVASLFELVPGVDAVAVLRSRGRFARRAVREDVATVHGACRPKPVRGESRWIAGIGILLPNSFGSAWLARRAGLNERWGYATDWRRRLLTRSVPVPRASMHQGRYYQQLVEDLGIPAGALEPRVDVTDAVRDQARAQLLASGWDGQQPIVAMAPGAAYGTAKRWLPRHFAQVVASLARDGVQTVLVGSGSDGETTGTIVADPQASSARVIDLAGRTSLQGLAGVLALSSACLSNDSGAMHLAGAIGTPIVALFGPTRETETAPLTRAGAHRDVLINPVWCRPCMLRECPIDHRCMKGLEPARVLAAIASIRSNAVGAVRQPRSGA